MKEKKELQYESLISQARGIVGDREREERETYGFYDIKPFHIVNLDLSLLKILTVARSLAANPRVNLFKIEKEIQNIREYHSPEFTDNFQKILAIDRFQSLQYGQTIANKIAAEEDPKTARNLITDISELILYAKSLNPQELNIDDYLIQAKTEFSDSLSKLLSIFRTIGTSELVAAFFLDGLALAYAAGYNPSGLYGKTLDNGDPKLFNLLLEKGAEVDSPCDSSGRTALDIILARGSLEHLYFIDKLMERGATITFDDLKEIVVEEYEGRISSLTPLKQDTERDFTTFLSDGQKMLYESLQTVTINSPEDDRTRELRGTIKFNGQFPFYLNAEGELGTPLIAKFFEKYGDRIKPD